MDILQWLFAKWHLLYILAILLTILGVIYLSCNFINKSIPRRITQSIAFAIVSAFIVFIYEFLTQLVSVISSIFFSLDNWKLNSGFDLKTVFSDPWEISVIILALLIGLLSEPINLLPHKQVHARKLKRKVNWEKNISLFSLGFFLLMFLSFILQQKSIVNLNPLSKIPLDVQMKMQEDTISSDVYNLANYFTFVSVTYGFIIGYLYDKTQINWNKIIVLILSISFILSFSYAINLNTGNTDLESFYLYLIQNIGSCILGYLAGVIFNRSRTSDSSVREGSWRGFYFYILLGLICTFCFSFFTRNLLHSYPLTQFVMFIGLLIAFGKGDGNKLIQQLKPKIKDTDIGKIRFTKNTGDRFVRAFVIGFINSCVYSSLNVIFLSIGNYNDEGVTPIIDFPRLFIEHGFFFPIVFIGVIFIAASLLFALFAGAICSVGPVLAIYIDNISEKRMFQIGALLTILAGIAAALPGILS